MKMVRVWLALLLASLVAACGGGGGNAGTPVLGGSGTVQVSVSSTTASADAPATVTAVVKDGAGSGISGIVVSFSTSGGLGAFSADTALTDSSGKATVTLQPASAAANGADEVVATATIGETTVTGKAGFTVSGSGASTGASTISLNLSSTTVTAAAPATVTATLLDDKGRPVVGAVVSFSTAGSLGTLSAPSALTDQNGKAPVALYPASSTTSGADQVIASATVNGTTVTAAKGFQLTATSVTIDSFTSDVPSGSKLGAYGQANLTVNVGGTAAGTPVSLSITSLCLTKSKATITPTTATTTNGTANFTYKDAGCGATDANDPVQVSIVGGTATSTVSIPLTTPTVSSLAFVSATPQQIFLKGSGFTENSEVVFQVRDQAGAALPNVTVTLAPTTLAGGLTVDGGATSVQKVSDSAGQVSVRINSGTVPTPVRIRASLVVGGATVTTVSSNLSIAVGLPAERNFSLSQGSHNIEGYNIDGTPNTYQVIASDRLGNPVPAGTSINFVTEGGGQVEAIKQTVIGTDGIARAVANFVSAQPKPDDGRITVVAYALGEESFLDTNGDNIYTAGEAFQDLGSVFVSESFVATYNSTTDQLISLGTSTGATCATVDPLKDPLGLLALNATIPSVGAATCDGAQGQTYVRRAIETVLSTSAARPLWGIGRPTGLDSGCAKVSLIDDTRTSRSYYLLGAGGLYGLGASGTLSFLAADANPGRLNPLAKGTTIAATATDGLTVSISGGSPVPDTTTASGASLTYKFDSATSGTITITFTSPSGLGTSFSFYVQAASGGTACSL